MDKFIEAIAYVKDELLGGSCPAEAVQAAAAELDLKYTAVFNRATTALGDLTTYAERAATLRKAEAESLEAGNARRAKEQAEIERANKVIAEGLRHVAAIRRAEMTPGERAQMEHDRALRALLKALVN